MSKESVILSVNNLVVVLKDQSQTLIDGISLQLYEGQILALVGESGSGKSLTALAIMRLLPDALAIKSGNVALAGDSLFSLTEAQMNRVRGQRIAMIFQEPQTSLNPVKTIGQQISEAIKLHQPAGSAEIRHRLLSLLEEVGIPDPQQRVDWYPHQLSGGQKQRVMIAMALACEPDLLIADEPTTALDVTIQKQVLELIKSLQQKRRLAVLLITHDMGVVAQMADTIAVMRQGKILEQGNARSFFAEPQHPYSRELIHSLPDTHHFLPRQEQKPLLAVKDLNIWFPIKKGILQRTVDHTKAVTNVSFEIGEAETLALVGESGSGKSTIGRGILRLLDITSGSIHFHGQSIGNLHRKSFMPFRKQIQVIFQDPFSSMNPRIQVREIIEEGMISLGLAQDENRRLDTIVRIMERVGLKAEHLGRYPHEFSGGQRQRIAIARALAVEPSLIICDEPTSALDVSIRGQVLRLLKELQQQDGISYLFITHDLSLIPHLAHRVAVMKDGEIVEQGITEQVMQQPQHSYTQELLAAVPRAQA